MAADNQDWLLREAERKRSEFEAALRSGTVNAPIFAGMTFAAFVKSLVIGSIVSVVTSLATRALTPRQQIERGNLAGQELRLPRSEQGITIPEVYGSDPEWSATPWAATTAFALGARVRPTAYNGHYYRVTVAGTSGASEPTWPTSKGGTVVNDGVTFINAGRAGGGVRLGPIIAWTSGIRKHSVPGQSGGKGPRPPEVTNIEYDIDLMHIWARGRMEYYAMFANTDLMFDFRRTAPLTGLLDPDVTPDDPYDPDLPPNAITPYTKSLQRYDLAAVEDAEETINGILVTGSHHVMGLYAGNQIQTPDPYMEAAVDAEHGPNSTPAYRGRAYSVHARVFLTKWLGAMPAFNVIGGSKAYRTATQICDHFCDRTGLLTAGDYDFSELSNLDVRGFVLGQKYAPAEPMEALKVPFNCYYYEADKIYGKLRGGAVVASLTSADLGWSEEEDEEGELQSLDTTVGGETDKPRRVDLKFTDPEKNLEQNSQGISRQILASERIDTLDIPLTLYPEEAREIAQRELIRRDIESTPHALNLDWSYLWLNAGDSIQVTEDDGFVHRVFIKSLRHNVGVIPVEGVAEDVSAYTQPVSTSGGDGFEQPPVPIPGMSILGFYDGPLLRDNENTVNNGSGMYAWAVKRRGDGDFASAGLYVDRGLGDEHIETFEHEATVGVCATALTATTSVHSMVADAVTVDLQSDNHTLESFTAEAVWAGAGAALFGKELGQILTATREPDTATFPNRWYVTVCLRGRRGTEFAINDHVIGEPFLLINSAVKFIPLDLNELLVPRTYHLVTSGQSLDDAAAVEKTFEGGSLKFLPPVHVRRKDDSVGNQLWEWDARLRLGLGLHGGLSGFDDHADMRFECEIFSDSSRTVVKRVIPVAVGIGIAGMIETHGSGAGDRFGSVTSLGNGLSASGSVQNINGRTLMNIPRTASALEASLRAEGDGSARLGLILETKNWQNPEVGTVDYAITLSSGGLGPTLTVSVGADTIYTEDASSYNSTGVRVRIVVSGTEVRFYKEWQGPGSHAIAVSAVAPQFPLRGFVGAGTDSSGEATVERLMMIAADTPRTIYSAAQQTEDFGSLQPTVYANIYQIDRRVGRGYPAEATLVNTL